jgi:predicted nucleic acid-binding protein
MPVTLIDTGILYPAGEEQRLDTSTTEVRTANEVLDGIEDGRLPPMTVLTSIEQETVDHIKEDGGADALQERRREWDGNGRLSFVHPSETVIELARTLVEQYDERVEFADATVLAYFNLIDDDRKAYYTHERKLDGLYDGFGIEPIHDARQPATW